LRTIQDEVNEDGDFMFPSISKNALKSRFDGYISFVKLHSSVSRGNMGFVEEFPRLLKRMNASMLVTSLLIVQKGMGCVYLVVVK
jgi:hypothetical protein